MTAKEYLSQYKHLNAAIRSKQRQLQELRDISTSVACRGSDCSGNESDRIGRVVAKILDTENEICGMIERLLELKREIEGVIGRVENPLYRQVLVLRYIEGETFEEISDKLHFCDRQIYRIHRKALAKINIPKKF